MKSKKAAMEMSVGTLVTIVLLMVVLGLGIFLIQKIFGGATDSVDVINEKVLNEINDLFSKEGAKVVVKLGSNKLAKIKAGTTDFGIAVAAETKEGDPATPGKMQYKLELARLSGDCVSVLGEPTVRDIVDQNIGQDLDFSGREGKVAYDIISFDVPDATARCSQKFTLSVRDMKYPVEGPLAYNPGTFFTIQIV